MPAFSIVLCKHVSNLILLVAFSTSAAINAPISFGFSGAAVSGSGLSFPVTSCSGLMFSDFCSDDEPTATSSTAGFCCVPLWFCLYVSIAFATRRSNSALNALFEFKNSSRPWLAPAAFCGCPALSCALWLSSSTGWLPCCASAVALSCAATSAPAVFSTSWFSAVFVAVVFSVPLIFSSCLVPSVRFCGRAFPILYEHCSASMCRLCLRLTATTDVFTYF